MSGTVKYWRDRRVGMLGLNRPAKLNAISRELAVDLRLALEEFERDDEVRVGILYGEGPGFCAGMDLAPDAYAKAADNAASDREHIEELARTWLRLWDCPKPIIAQVHGVCFAGGTQIPLCCDFVVIADETMVGWPKLPVGAGWISPMWSFYVGAQRAKMMSFKVGSVISGVEAYEWGYAAEHFPQSSLAEQTMRIATEIAMLPSDLLKIKKLANNRVLDGQGFRSVVLAGAEWDAIAHTTSTVIAAQSWIGELGLKGAISKFKQEGM